MENLIIALLLTLFAGLSTTIGSFIAFFLKKPSEKFITFIMGFAVGVMIFVSFVELLQAGIESTGFMPSVIFLLIGMLSMLIIDVSISHIYELEDFSHGRASTDLGRHNPGHHNPGYHIQDLSQCDLNNESYIINQKSFRHKKHRHQHRDQRRHKDEKLKRMEKTSILVFLGIFIHNLPEGMATFVSALKDIELGVLLAFAIAIHNIPEGIAVSVPIYQCTGSRIKAIFWSFLSGISEFLGVLVVTLFLLPFYSDFLIGIMLSIVAGFMIYVSLDELLPASHSSNGEHVSILGVILGMAIMAISLAFLIA